ncbi:hypothetical protein CDAR_496181 [Caerostris darwini]|uniref:Uncharacterized protein n=1 Tax=Caerostris darwini TaxID=1538125 RepID=A0AAV4U1U9_9ARAC|nr:hypothetical protein CDAR_496181 [Caerostris darwini]
MRAILQTLKCIPRKKSKWNKERCQCKAASNRRGACQFPVSEAFPAAYLSECLDKNQWAPLVQHAARKPSKCALWKNAPDYTRRRMCRLADGERSSLELKRFHLLIFNFCIRA